MDGPAMPGTVQTSDGEVVGTAFKLVDGAVSAGWVDGASMPSTPASAELVGAGGCGEASMSTIPASAVSASNAVDGPAMPGAVRRTSDGGLFGAGCDGGSMPST
eukprot:CAMPEP_0206838932 /NCGR_PEP_ID=MMETSP0975-20121206/21168_1 /ASSEMBLY_ACC=CAM_ASM_000399 /TAXON_ID=483370 /ORGANISM="non described non described, Strain CCMP2097" /LENGTH=103 /DNA_ID=CAMNT_0054381381 /DNA_START=46 /DNA_END=354 /DNA_ORIENTATION=-